MTDPTKIYQLLGMAARARKIVTGEDLVVREVRSGHAELVILSKDASANTMKKLTNKCNTYNVEKHDFGSREDLGHAIGKEARVVLALTDKGFAKKLSELLNEYNRGWANDENTST
ncbi:YlxQ family RNA-binding protein [Mammaliicoccus sciuri]|uniref:Ribosomal protein L7Ae n=2 Tax=Sporosarcina newyorkensis TaxID=759851 RepID=A0A1T4YF14_9BACL|nr:MULTISPECIES: YlxQ family RNA-binding protein [Sporosarcina]EGQ27480.1 50S ribosomal protein L7/L12 [Sporosarcina newyorkensis 2681]MBY0222020.1 YlxQ family RNA-binding protein [Sporosarcina aquimarina]SKA99901.1 Ribosomal protein L7Ae [Sporosarcina newyorkensis]